MCTWFLLRIKIIRTLNLVIVRIDNQNQLWKENNGSAESLTHKQQKTPWVVS